MHRIFFVILLVFFITGLFMIGTGLASLPDRDSFKKVDIATDDQELANLSIKSIEDEFNEEDEDIWEDDEEEVVVYTNPYFIKIGKTVKLSDVPRKAGLSEADVRKISDELANLQKKYWIKLGSKIQVEYEKTTFPQERKFKELKFYPKPTQSITVTVKADKAVSIAKDIPLTRTLVKAESAIYGSFYNSALKSGLTPETISELVKAFSYDVDFQRDIKAGDKFVVMFEALTNKETNYVMNNKIIFASLKLGKRKIELIRFVNSQNVASYYHLDGSNVKKALLKTPIDGVKITSGFGMRVHPLLGYSKMHKGVDFGAATGTPIYAAGDGVVEEMDVKRGYGNYLRIKHNSSYSTAYAHISRYAKSVRRGMQVRQGQIIAYVGATGMATGPHLHFEVLESGTQINPENAKVALGNKLTGTELARFNKIIGQIQLALKSSQKIALAD